MGLKIDLADNNVLTVQEIPKEDTPNRPVTFESMDIDGMLCTVACGAMR